MVKKLVILLLFAAYNVASAQKSPPKSIGVVYLKKSISGDKELSNTMKIYESSELKISIATYVFNENDLFDLKVVGNSINRNTLFEFGYEVFGLPILEIGTNYCRVVYGYDDNNKELSGFVSLFDLNIEYKLWFEHLIDMPIFFIKDSQKDFYESPNGERVNSDLELLDGKEDYIMYPQEIRNDWMKVKVTTPSNYCDEPESINEKILWIKYTENDGQLNVWYYTRGC